METIMQWLLLAAAVAIGWLLGRWRGDRKRGASRISDESELRERLQFLFTNYSDEAIESFVQGLPVNRDTVSMHFSIGAHFRNKGEVDRAILIHQNLLARPELPVRYSSQVTYELAMDYLAAGLLDRAESLFHQLMGSKDYALQSARQLIELYQQEREWEKARQVAGTLTKGDSDQRLSKQLAYLSCEIASEALKQEDFWQARQLLKEALEQDRTCVRATLLLAELHRRQYRPREARATLLKVFEQNPAFGPEAVDRLIRMAREEGSEARLARRLHKLYDAWPSTSLLLAYIDCLERSEGRAPAIAFLRQELEIRPSLRALLRLIELAGYEKGMTSDEGRLVSRMGETLLKNRPIYRCVQCGFSGRQLHWLCPSCKTWESVQPIQGVEGE